MNTIIRIMRMILFKSLFFKRTCPWIFFNLSTMTLQISYEINGIAKN